MLKRLSITKFPIHWFLLLLCCGNLLTGCSIQKKISKTASASLLGNPELKTAHVGISIFEPATNSFWYNFQSNKNFVPASNTKIFTCYMAMKYLGDSLPALSYTESNDALQLVPTGDPTLLHPDYKFQPVIQFLKQTNKKITIQNSNWKEEALGAGWAWDDYNGDYMAERSALPVYGNTIRFVQTQTIEKQEELEQKPQTTIYTNPEINWKLNFNPDTSSKNLSITRNRNENIFSVTEGKEKFKEQEVPFVTNGILSALELLKDTLDKEIIITSKPAGILSAPRLIRSQPTDSMLRPMMFRSDNFFAEQTLLMISNQLLGVMNDDKIIDTLIKRDLVRLPQRPNWVDGSGLSRYNQFSPEDFVWILNTMKQEFGWKRISNIFATGNQGTLTNYYVKDSSFIYAKTGSLSGVIALSGYLKTRKNKDLIFSVLVNNHASSGRNVRRAVEKFIESIREQY